MIPVVLHYGIFGYRRMRLGPWGWDYFQGIDKALQKRGHRVIFARVDAAAPVARRAQQLKDALAHEKGPLLIIGHSMGGLDARYMITHLGMADRVAVLLSVCTPHRGSPYADWTQRHMRRLHAVATLRRLGLDIAGIADVTTAACARFNVQTPDAPGVRYYSIAAVCPPRLLPPFARHPHRIIAAAEGGNDGLVSERSAQWGEHLATWQMQHSQTINHHWLCPLKVDVAPMYLDALDQIQAKL